eukprot:m.1391013 g.1391013  ORF g.1391013 m.1391013 type:complete len:99 (-) comp24990_c2_seq8:1551-1847(-)
MLACRLQVLLVLSLGAFRFAIMLRRSACAPYSSISSTLLMACLCDFRFILIGCIEYSWNVFPATPVSSGLLQACHGIILIALWQASVGAAAASARKTK